MGRSRLLGPVSIALITAVSSVAQEKPSDDASLGFSSFFPPDAFLRAGGKAEFHYIKLSSGPSEFTLHRVDPKKYREALERSEPGTAPVLGPEAWEPGGETHRELPDAQSSSDGRVTFPARPGPHVIEERRGGSNKRHAVRVCTFGVYLQAISGRALAFAFRPDTGAPVSGVSVKARTREGTFESRTNEEGLSYFECPSRATVIAWKDEEVHGLALESPAGEKDALVYITTDRLVYRPGDLVHWKAIARERVGPRSSLPAGQKARVDVLDGNGGLVEGKEHAWSKQGSIAGFLRLAPDSPAGAYQLVVQLSGGPSQPLGRIRGEHPLWAKQFLVANPRRAGIEVSVDFVPSGSFDRRRARVRARYLSGLPAAGAELEWSTRFLSVSPRAPQQSWSAGQTASAWLFEREDGDSGPRRDERIDDLDSGAGVIGPDGSLDVTFTWRSWTR